MKDWERTTDTTTKQFLELMKFLADNDLLDAAAEACESQGLSEVRISVQHIRAIQEMISSKSKSAGGVASVLSAHVDGACAAN